MKTDPIANPDLAGSRTKSLLIWGLPVAVMLLSAYFDFGIRFAWPAALGWMGTACIRNALSCGRTHCYFTGPFFLLMAIVSGVHGFDVFSFGSRGWEWIGGLSIFGGGTLTVVPERIWGRYRDRPPACES